MHWKVRTFYQQFSKIIIIYCTVLYAPNFMTVISLILNIRFEFKGIWQLSVKCSSFLFSRAIRSRERASLRCDRNVRRFSLVCSDELRSCSATVAPRNFAGFSSVENRLFSRLCSSPKGAFESTKYVQSLRLM